jgi:hypothetical protein
MVPIGRLVVPRPVEVAGKPEMVEDLAQHGVPLVGRRRAMTRSITVRRASVSATIGLRLGLGLVKMIERLVCFPGGAERTLDLAFRARGWAPVLAGREMETRYGSSGAERSCVPHRNV